jgi:hypothetical protein
MLSCYCSWLFHFSIFHEYQVFNAYKLNVPEFLVNSCEYPKILVGLLSNWIKPKVLLNLLISTLQVIACGQ